LDEQKKALEAELLKLIHEQEALQQQTTLDAAALSRITNEKNETDLAILNLQGAMQQRQCTEEELRKDCAKLAKVVSHLQEQIALQEQLSQEENDR